MLTEQLLVVFEAIRVIIVVALENVPPARGSCEDHTAKFRVRKFFITQKVDGAYACSRALVDIKNHIDAVAFELPHARCHRCAKTARSPVDFDHALGIGLGTGSRVDGPRLEFDFLFELVVVEPFVANIDHAVNDRVLLDLDLQKAVACVKDHLRVFEETRREETLQALVNHNLINVRARRDREVRPNRFWLQPLRPGDHDLAYHGREVVLSCRLGTSKQKSQHRKKQWACSRKAHGQQILRLKETDDVVDKNKDDQGPHYRETDPK